MFLSSRHLGLPGPLIGHNRRRSQSVAAAISRLRLASCRRDSAENDRNRRARRRPRLSAGIRVQIARTGATVEAPRWHQRTGTAYTGKIYHNRLILGRDLAEIREIVGKIEAF